MELQQIARNAGHEYPLLIAIDQENGMLNNLYDQHYLTQFPGNMAIVATQSTDIAKDVAKATGKELKALGINWILGPVVDVLTNSANRLLGVRTMGDDPEEVTRYALKFLEGYREAGIATCGKHFPGYGNATVDSTLGLPVVPDSIAQLETASLIPFRTIIKDNIDSIMVGGCALPKVTMNEMHACLSEEVVQQMLRVNMKHKGVIVSECLEMKTLYENVGVRQGTMMAAMAGCDVIIVCSSYKLQLEAISGIFGAVRDKIIDSETVRAAAERVITMKRKFLSWDDALNPPPLSYLLELKHSHADLSTRAYQKSITVLRDHSKYLPLQESVEPDGDILLLTPLVAPIINTGNSSHGGSGNAVNSSEDVFKGFGRVLSRIHSGKILHTSYTANGYIPENLMDQAKAVIVVTTDAGRNLYQIGFTTNVGLICSQQRKPMVAIAASSPYDLALVRRIGTYLCIYEFTQESLAMTAKVLFGQLKAEGKFPGSGLYQNRLNDGPKSLPLQRRWLVEEWSWARDLQKLKELWEICFPDRRFGRQFDMFVKLFDDRRNSNNEPNGKQKHFIVRNSSTGGLYGFCATWVHKDLNVGSIMMLFVTPSRRGMAIGQSLHERAFKYLKDVAKVSMIRLGSRVPSFFEGIPLSSQFNRRITDNKGNPLSSSLRAVDVEATSSTSFSTGSSSSSTGNGSFSSLNVDLVEWFRHAGWNIRSGRRSNEEHEAMHVRTMLMSNLKEWIPSVAITQSVSSANIGFQFCSEGQGRDVMKLIRKRCGQRKERAGIAELYSKALSRQSTERTVVVAIDGRDNRVVGSIILFTLQSSIFPYMPWILEFDDARVGGFSGLLVDEKEDVDENSGEGSGGTGGEIIKQGLVLWGLDLFKNHMELDRCAIAGIEGDKEATIMQECGFGHWRRYLEVSQVCPENV